MRKNKKKNSHPCKIIYTYRVAVLFLAMIIYAPLALADCSGGAACVQACASGFIPTGETCTVSAADLSMPGVCCQQATATQSTSPTANNPSGSSNYFNQEKIPGAGTTSDFVEYIKQIIRFGFAAIGIIALFMLSVGAYQYLMAAGNLAKTDRAKETISSALLGLVLGLIAFITLRTINPQLVNLQLTSPGGGTGGQTTGTGAGTGATGAGGTRSCEPNLGNCQISNLGCFGADAEKASRICGYESVAGNPNAMSGRDLCKGEGANGESFSVGLFQINLTQHDLGMGCTGAFNGKNGNCVVIKPELYQQCVAKAKDQQFNINYACQLYNQNSGFRDWQNTVKTCGL